MATMKKRTCGEARRRPSSSVDNVEYRPVRYERANNKRAAVDHKSGSPPQQAAPHPQKPYRAGKVTQQKERYGPEGWKSPWDGECASSDSAVTRHGQVSGTITPVEGSEPFHHSIERQSRYSQSLRPLRPGNSMDDLPLDVPLFIARSDQDELLLSRGRVAATVPAVRSPADLGEV